MQELGLEETQAPKNSYSAVKSQSEYEHRQHEVEI